VDDEDEIETNPSNMGTPIQALQEFPGMLHQRTFSSQSNPWMDATSGNSAGGSRQRLNSHGSKSSLSKLNVEAPEFKFNPESTFKPGQFVFSSNSFQPAVTSSINSATSSHFTFPATTAPSTSKINVNAPVFSPGQSEFSFSASGPKFRPDAPAFTPHSLTNSINSPISGPEGHSKRASIFGSIDLNKPEIVMPVKASKAVPIVKPDLSESADLDGGRERPADMDADESRHKRRVLTKGEDDSAVPLFADQPTEDGTPVPESRFGQHPEDESLPLEEKSFDESNYGQVDTMLSSTMVSDTTDTKATVSPSETTDPAWGSFEAKTSISESTIHGHKKSLSATAKAFVPGVPLGQQEPAKAPEVDGIMKLVERLRGPSSPQAQEEEQIVQSIEEPEPEPEPLHQSPTPVASLEAAFSSETVPPEEAPAITKGLGASRYASTPSPPPKRKGLSASRFAASPTPESDHEVQESPADTLPVEEQDEHAQVSDAGEPDLADIDAIMRHLNENPHMGVNKTFDNQPQWAQPNQLAPVTDSSPLRLAPQNQFRSDAPSPTPRNPTDIDASKPIRSTELEDPFVDPPQSAQSFEGPIHRLNGSESVPASEWDGIFSDDEQAKLENRANFFDGHVNDVVGGLLSARLGPLEHSLESIKHALTVMSRRSPSSRRERRSMSAEIRESDADDEDDDMPVPRRSMSPRRDRKMEQIRAAVLDAFAVHQRNAPKEPEPAPVAPAPVDNSAILLKALEEMKEQLLSKAAQSESRPDEIKQIVEEALERRIPPPPAVPEGKDEKDEKIEELQAKMLELEERLRGEETKVEAAVAARRAAEDRAADMSRELESASTKIEVEMMNKTALNQRINDLEERVKTSEHQAEEEIKIRRQAEDRLSEVQRLLRISSEEEVRLREVVEEKEQKIKSIEAQHSKSSMRLALLEAGQASAQQSQSDGQNRINSLETELRDARKEAQQLRIETDRITEVAQRRDVDLTHALDENRALHKLIDTLGTQVQENERVRDGWRTKFITLQEEMAQAARAITEENARRTKKEQALLARQEVLDARLQAEARTRERIETELERLEMNERQGMRAVAECKRLEKLVGEMRTENHKLQQASLRYQAEFQEARESGAREVKRTREAMQAEVEEANHQVNVVRGELEDQMSRLRAQLDQVRLDADTARARHDMLLEEAETSKRVALEELTRKHQNEMEDMQARYERQIGNTTEDAQRAEQNLLERLSISTSKEQHLQDKVSHLEEKVSLLEEKLDIAKEAARAAAQAVVEAKASAAAAAAPAVSDQSVGAQSMAVSAPKSDLPEKISPQALRETIMVLQEQLQEREQRIEDLEQTVARLDPDAESKISKRDDEIIWLRELLAVRHSDLQDIIAALGRDDYDKNAVKDAAIRLKANLQMEEQERERAMNGGSAIKLPNIAATIREAATPARVREAVGPLAAAWGNWRRGRETGSFGSLSGVLSSPGPGSSSTPSKRVSPAADLVSPTTTTARGSSNSLLGGLLTPPASGVRQIPSSSSAPLSSSSTFGGQQQQPTAFSATGRRFASGPGGLASQRPRGPSSASMTATGNETPIKDVHSRSRGMSSSAVSGVAPPAPSTPPRMMLKPSAYDDDAQVEDFDDAGFFEDD